MDKHSTHAEIPSKIKNLYIELPDYTFNHSLAVQNLFFVGRGKVSARLKTLLSHSGDCASGAYLVTGYRGMGKTSMVERVIKEVNKEDKVDSVSPADENTPETAGEINEAEREQESLPMYIKINISLSLDDIKDIDVLKFVATQLTMKWSNLSLKLLNVSKPHSEEIMKIEGRLLWLSQHLNAVVKLNSGTNNNSKGQQPGLEDVSNYRSKEIIRAESLPKEIEKELISILDQVDDLRLKMRHYNIKKGSKTILDQIDDFRKNIWRDNTKNAPETIPYFVFIIDELDKIEPNYFYDVEYSLNDIPTQEKLDNLFGINKVRRRQEVIARLLANLKSFLNTAKAKFIFIGGREMYDAALADIADRDSFYSSIFHDIIYVESFFKEKISDLRGGLTRTTEAYLCKVIIPLKYAKLYWNDKYGAGAEAPPFNDEAYSLSTCFHYLIDSHVNSGKPQYHLSTLKSLSSQQQQAIYKLLFFLQNFVVFLTFRSNGTPKKLVALLESYMVALPSEKVNALNGTSTSLVAEALWWKEDGALPMKEGEALPRKEGERLFLRFNFNQQYEIGLTTNMYRPYIIIHSRYLKSLGDKLLYSTAYIMDYLLKYHPHAFSWRNLELIPEIILVNKDPNLRYFLSDILKFLTGMYIRETTNSMFEYTFYSKQANEIRLLSKISETASAAFNFTLDESLQIIRYYRRKLEELKRSHPNYTQEYIHSIGFVQNILGDLYYFDKEYDEAIIYYADSVQILRRLAQQAPKQMTKHQCVLYVRSKLMLGLCLEKISAFDSAYSTYRELILDVPFLLDSVMTRPGSEQALPMSFDGEWDKPIRRMQLFIKPHIALLDLIEKQRMDGITAANLERNLQEATQFLLGDKTPSSEKKRDGVRVSTLLSDYYSNVGSLLFFKNKNFPELLEKLDENHAKHSAKLSLYSFVQKRKGNHTYLPSLSALTYYYLGLEELISSYEVKIVQVILAEEENSNLADNGKAFLESFHEQNSPILKALYLLHPVCQGIINNNILLNLGNLLSRIGDALIASLSATSLRAALLKQEVLNVFGNEQFDETLSDYPPILSELKALMTAQNAKTHMLEDLCDINKALAIYRMAGLFYLKASRTYSYAFQYKKFLFVLKDYLLGVSEEQLREGVAPQSTSEDRLQLMRKNCEGVAVKIFNANTWLSDVSNRPQILKYREVLRGTDKGFDKDETRKIYLSLSTSSEIRETIVLVEEIMLKTATLLNIHHGPEDMEKLKTHLTPYDLVTSRFSRTHELRYNSEVNFYKLKRKEWDVALKSSIMTDMQNLDILDEPEKHEEMLKTIKQTQNIEAFSLPATIFTNKPDRQALKVASLESEIKDRLRHLRETGEITQQSIEKAFPELSGWHKVQWQDLDQEWVKQLICDSVFSLFEVIRTLNLYGTNYISNYSFLANVHFKLANWCQLALNYDLIMAQKGESEATPLRDLLKATLNEEDVHYLEPNYHNELAIQHYYSAIQTHSGGKAFKKFNQAMSFLEDDFNDNLTLFSAACERFRINTGLVDGKIQALKQKVRFSSIYDYGNYVEGW